MALHVTFFHSIAMLLERFKKLIGRNVKDRAASREIAPDEIFLDSHNLPEFNRDQFEGRLEKPIGTRVIIAAGTIFLLIGLLFTARLFTLQIRDGAAYVAKSTANRLRHSVLFAARGIVYDRTGRLLVSNVEDARNADIARRRYADIVGVSSVLGYVKYPSKDSAGFYYTEDYTGLGGIEKFYNTELGGTNGMRIVETDAHGTIISESLLRLPEDGKNLTLSVDARVQEKLYGFMKDLSDEIGFDGGAGALMDVESGELLALVSFPEYQSNILSDGTDKSTIARYSVNPKKLFLNRPVDGLYTPGSIVKPFLALGVLQEGLISPEKQILSTGSISIPNPFDPKKRSVFNDWRPQGLVDMRHALAVSSNVYFYEVGGGFEDQKGLGIEGIEKYARMFGLGEPVPSVPFFGKRGVVPSPVWKAENFKGDPWRIGDTYNTAIGQYGFQITLLQAVRATAAVANGGMLLTPTLIRAGGAAGIMAAPPARLPVDPAHFKVVQEGMRLGVLEGTAKNLNIPEVEIAAKTGTAEIGTTKKQVNSWVIGFFPYKHPRYAFAILMEAGPRDNTVGALFVLRRLIEWMSVNTPEYLK